MVSSPSLLQKYMKSTKLAIFEDKLRALAEADQQESSNELDTDKYDNEIADTIKINGAMFDCFVLTICQ